MKELGPQCVNCYEPIYLPGPERRWQHKFSENDLCNPTRVDSSHAEPEVRQLSDMKRKKRRSR